MLKEWDPGEISREEVKERLEKAREALSVRQMKLKEYKLPVLVLLEGWGAAGKGSTIGRVIRDIDPRFFKVTAMDMPSKEERRKPFLWRFFTQIPEQGSFRFLDSGWMEQVTREVLKEEHTRASYQKRIDSICRFERQLADDGCLVLKFFFHVDQKEQKERLEGLLKNKDTSWRVSKFDRWQNKHYNRCKKVYDRYLEDTEASGVPWHIVDASDSDRALLSVLETLVEGIDTAMQGQKQTVPAPPDDEPRQKAPLLSEISLEGKEADAALYKEQLKKLQKRLGELHNRLYRKQVPVVILYEGWDAAGKGGNIKRITKALDPRGFEVCPIASPEPHEKARHYLWRFWTRLPKTGHVTIFDRSWYGRVMVERIEGFCTENDWKRAYHEINEFEKELTDWGAAVIKFWVQIDRDTQLERFREREKVLEKQWKITQEDWRNREKWDLYEEAVNEMLQKTSTAYAPWHILESKDKKYARLKALKIVIRELEKALE